MQSKKLRLSQKFRVTIGNDRSQAAEMVLAPGEVEGGPDNRHRGSDQWPYIVEGNGAAIINGRRKALVPQSLILIEHGDTHEIHNTGDEPLRTLNFHVPPTYSDDGEEMPVGRG
jgi:mannose-6-phosphate isomerase-like protein (cupin superfamily)